MHVDLSRLTCGGLHDAAEESWWEKTCGNSKPNMMMQPWTENRLVCAWQCHLAVEMETTRRQGGDQGDKMDVSDRGHR